MLSNIQSVHFIGICGTAMASVAAALQDRGVRVTGSDANVYPPMSTFLADRGVEVQEGYRKENLSDAPELVVIGNAISRGNPEAEAVLERKLRYCSLPELLKETFIRGKRSIVIAGTHGKTTTTSLVGTILAGGNLDPTVIIGGRLKSIGGHAHFGESDILVAEADESDGSFLHLSPTIAVVTTLDEEHMDYYKTLENMKETFLSFLNRVPFYGSAVLCLDDPNLQSMIPFIEKRHITYGLTTQADYTARNIFVDGLKTGSQGNPRESHHATCRPSSNRSRGSPESSAGSRSFMNLNRSSWLMTMATIPRKFGPP